MHAIVRSMCVQNAISFPHISLCPCLSLLYYINIIYKQKYKQSTDDICFSQEARYLTVILIVNTLSVRRVTELTEQCYGARIFRHGHLYSCIPSVKRLERKQILFKNIKKGNNYFHLRVGRYETEIERDCGNVYRRKLDLPDPQKPRCYCRPQTNA